MSMAWSPDVLVWLGYEIKIKSKDMLTVETPLFIVLMYAVFAVLKNIANESALYFSFLSGFYFHSPIKLSWIHYAKHFSLSFWKKYYNHINFPRLPFPLLK